MMVIGNLTFKFKNVKFLKKKKKKKKGKKKQI